MPDPLRVLVTILLVGFGVWLLTPRVHSAIVRYFVEVDTPMGRVPRARTHSAWAYVACVVVFDGSSDLSVSWC